MHSINDEPHRRYRAYSDFIVPLRLDAAGLLFMWRAHFAECSDMTPPLPTWIREQHVHGYTNVFSLLPTETRLFGTESLYGDWNGRALLLAKDFACSKLVHDRIQEHDARPYRHEPKLVTNTRLRRFADPLTTGSEPNTCGLLYGSALACLLRDDEKMSGSLPNRKEALAFGKRVVSFVVEHMPHLQAIVCMGQEAWQCTAGALDIDGSWQDARDSGRAVDAGAIAVIATYHPAARISREKAGQPWEMVRRVLSPQPLGRIDPALRCA